MKWQLDSVQINKVLNSGKKISTHEWHYLFYHLPCDYRGTINLRDTTFSFQLNAGRWFLLTDTEAKKERYYAVDGLACAKYFIMCKDYDMGD